MLTDRERWYSANAILNIHKKQLKLKVFIQSRCKILGYYKFHH